MAATGQWNQILLPVKRLIRIRKADTVRAAASGRGSFASQSETMFGADDGSRLSSIREARGRSALASIGKPPGTAVWPPKVSR